jgi:hypothetical protein
MSLRIVVGKDCIPRGNDGDPLSFSDRWKTRAEMQGIACEVIDPPAPGAVEKIRAADGFLWRYNFQGA